MPYPSYIDPISQLLSEFDVLFSFLWVTLGNTVTSDICPGSGRGRRRPTADVRGDDTAQSIGAGISTYPLKLARTITDLAGSDEIQPVHLADVLQYRPKLMMG
jgi:hypothetical protein